MKHIRIITILYKFIIKYVLYEYILKFKACCESLQLLCLSSNNSKINSKKYNLPQNNINETVNSVISKDNRQTTVPLKLIGTLGK